MPARPTLFRLLVLERCWGNWVVSLATSGRPRVTCPGGRLQARLLLAAHLAAGTPRSEMAKAFFNYS